jgi:hypothetical protein
LAIGVVIGNENGELLGARSELVEFGIDAVAAEAMAALQAIEFSVDRFVNLI